MDEAAALAAQLPMLVRGFYYEGWHPHGKPVKERHREDFLAPIVAAFRDDPTVDPERVVQAVFQVLSKHVTSGEIDCVKQCLPAEIRSLWMYAAQALHQTPHSVTAQHRTDIPPEEVV